MLLHGIKKLLNIPGYKITDASLFDTAMHLYLEPYKKKKPLCSRYSTISSENIPSRWRQQSPGRKVPDLFLRRGARQG
jgi:hypothetical protein